jgi:hypothetical protein
LASAARPNVSQAPRPPIERLKPDLLAFSRKQEMIETPA